MTSQAWIACLILAVSVAAVAQDDAVSASAATDTGGTPLIQLIETVSKQTGKTFIIDPRVSGNARLVGIGASKLTYADLLTVLQVHGFAAVESGGIVRVIPDALVRATPTPLITGSGKHADSEHVTRIIRVKSVPAAQLVPILRSLLPQNAHLAAFQCTNELIIADTYANVRRIESVIAEMDKGEPLQLEKCKQQPPAEMRPMQPQPGQPPQAPPPGQPPR